MQLFPCRYFAVFPSRYRSLAICAVELYNFRHWSLEFYHLCGDAGNPAGFYYSKYNGNTVLIQDEGVKKPDGSAGGALCTDATMDAETWSKYGFMLCCPRMFQLPANVATAVGTNGGTPKGTNINIFKTAAGAFLHEMMHFLDLNTATGTKSESEPALVYLSAQWLTE